MNARKRTTVAAWLIALGAAVIPMTLPAQGTGATATGGASTTQTDNNRRDDRGSNWGWIGLIGLAGLLGMRRREPEVRSERTYDRTSGTTTGSTTGRV